MGDDEAAGRRAPERGTARASPHAGTRAARGRHARTPSRWGRWERWARVARWAPVAPGSAGTSSTRGPARAPLLEGPEPGVAGGARRAWRASSVRRERACSGAGLLGCPRWSHSRRRDPPPGRLGGVALVPVVATSGVPHRAPPGRVVPERARAAAGTPERGGARQRRWRAARRPACPGPWVP